MGYWRIASKFMAAPHSAMAASDAVTMTDIALLKDPYFKRAYNTYKEGMPAEELEEKLISADISEKIAAYCAGVPEEVAQKRMEKASELERGLIFAYCRGVYNANIKKSKTDVPTGRGRKALTAGMENLLNKSHSNVFLPMYDVPRLINLPILIENITCRSS